MAKVIEGLDETLKALDTFYPDLYKGLKKEVIPLMRGLVQKSQALVPNEIEGLSGWMRQKPDSKSRTSRNRAFPIYDPKIIRKGFTYSALAPKKQSNGWVNMFVLFNKSAAGAIMETAGRKNPSGDSRSQSNNREAGVRFINTIAVNVGKLYRVGKGDKSRGRIIFQVLEKDAGKTRQAIEAAIQSAKDKTQGKINNASKVSINGS